MIRNYTGRVVHLRQRDGSLLTLKAERPKAWVQYRPRVVGVIECEGLDMPLTCHVPEIHGLPSEDVESGVSYLVNDMVFAAAKDLDRADCYAIDYGSGKPLKDGPIWGSGYEYSLLRTPWEFDEPGTEADEAVVLALNLAKAGEL